MGAPGDIAAQTARDGIHHNRPTAAPRAFPFEGHRTCAEFYLHPVAIIEALVTESAQYPEGGRRGARDARRDHIMTLKAKGWKQTAIARRFGISDTLVSKIIKQARDQGLNKISDASGFTHSGEVSNAAPQ